MGVPDLDLRVTLSRLHRRRCLQVNIRWNKDLVRKRDLRRRGQLLTRSTRSTHSLHLWNPVVKPHSCTAPNSKFWVFFNCRIILQIVGDFPDVLQVRWKLFSEIWWRGNEENQAKSELHEEQGELFETKSKSHIFHWMLPEWWGIPDNCRTSVYFQKFLLSR